MIRTLYIKNGTSSLIVGQNNITKIVEKTTNFEIHKSYGSIEYIDKTLIAKVELFEKVVPNMLGKTILNG